jgi:hypothetical protein
MLKTDQILKNNYWKYTRVDLILRGKNIPIPKDVIFDLTTTEFYQSFHYSQG